MIVTYMLSDGRLVPFTHPDAVKERKEAIAKWEPSVGFYADIVDKWTEYFSDGSV